jgi:outer membrane protein TolC
MDRSFSGTMKGAFFQNNYRFGLSLSVPLRLSQARGDYQAAKLKIEHTRLTQTLKRIELQNKVKAYFTEWQQTSIQQERQTTLIHNYSTLQKGEETRFFNGESSLFLINTRELKTIEAQQKLVTLQAQKQQARIHLFGAAGILGSY